MTNIKDSKLVFLLAFFSSFSPFLFLKLGEHQPTAFFVSIIFVLAIVSAGREVGWVPSVCAMVAVICAPVILFYLFSADRTSGDSIKTLIILLSGPFLWFYLSGRSSWLDHALVYRLCLLFGGLSFVAVSPVSEVVSHLIDPLLQTFFASRSSIHPVGGRGVGIFFPEPSHAAPYLILVFALAHFFYSKNLYSKRQSKGLIVSFIFCVLANSSKTIIIFSLVYMFSYIVYSRKLRYLVLSIFGIFLGGVYLVFSEAAALTAFQSAYELYLEGGLTLDSTSQFASARFMAAYIYSVIPFYHPLGLGFSGHVENFVGLASRLNIDYSTVYAFKEFGLDRVPFNPRSYFYSLYYSLGILGYIIAGVFVLYVLRILALLESAALRSLVVVSAIQILFMGIPSLNAPWIMLSACVASIKLNFGVVYGR